MLGYKFQLTRKTPNIPKTTFRHQSGVDVLDSLGMVLSPDGNISNLLLGSPADRARLGPAMKVIGVNGRKWSGARLVEALVEGQDRPPIDLLVEDGDLLRTIQLHYYGGPQYQNLVRQKDEADLLGELLKAK